MARLPNTAVEGSATLHGAEEGAEAGLKSEARVMWCFCSSFEKRGSRELFWLSHGPTHAPFFAFPLESQGPCGLSVVPSVN